MDSRNSDAAPRLAIPKPPFVTPMTKAVLALGACGTLFACSRLGGQQSQAVVQLLITAFLFFVMGAGCARIMKVPSERAVTRFWKACKWSNHLRGAADLLQAAWILAAPTPHPEVQVPVVAGIYGVALLLVAREFAFYPLAAKTPKERTRLLLDLLTVMVVVTGVSWYFIIAPTLHGTPDPIAVLKALGTFALVLVYAQIVKLLLSNTQLLTRRSNMWALLTTCGYAVAGAATTALTGTDLVWVVLVLRVLTGVANYITIHNQEYDLLCDVDVLSKKVRRPYSLVPYFAIAGLYVLLVFAAIDHNALGVATAGLLVTVIVTTAVVVVRQLASFIENAALLTKLDDNLHELTASYEREKELHREREQLEIELRHAQKLDAIGRLAGGVAHEINTPVQYVNDNMSFLQQSFGEMTRLVNGCRQGVHIADRNDIDVDYLVHEVPLALSDATSGLGRVAEIVRSLKSFGSADGVTGKAVCDVNSVIVDTLTIARSQLSDVAEVVFERGEVPPVLANLQDLGQVWLSLLVNAADAIEERGGRGNVHVRSWLDGSTVVVEVADDGIGMTEAVRERIFDPFFTTKPVGVGTGQGLSVARSIVVEGHGGAIDCESEPGVGSRFRVRLPAVGAQESGDAPSPEHATA